MGIVVRVRIAGARETLKAFKTLPKDASNELKDENQHIADSLAGKIRAAAAGSSRQSALVASGIKARRDRVPSIVASGTKRVGRNRKPLNKIMFGANFGGTTLKQFRPHRGAGDDDYWFYKTVEDNQAQIEREWLQAVDKVLERWGRG